MNKVWLVTGSASGLGPNIAEAVLESGDRLVATARDPKRLDDLVKKYGDRVRAVPLDVTDESAAQTAVQTAVATFGRLDVVVNNAGYGDIAPFEQLSAERSRWFRLLSVTWPALIPYSQDSDNIEFTLIVYSSSAERLCFENTDCASDVPRPLRRASAREHAHNLRIKSPPLSACYVLDESLGCATVGEVR